MCNIRQFPHIIHAGICRACDKRVEQITTVVYDPLVEATLVVNESTLFVDVVDRPLLCVTEGEAVQVIFARQTRSKTEYVSARFRTLHGQERTLTFPRVATLGALFFFCIHKGIKNREIRRGKQLS